MLAKLAEKYLKEHPTFATDIEKCCFETFARLDEAILSKSWQDGSTGCVVVRDSVLPCERTTSRANYFTFTSAVGAKGLFLVCQYRRFESCYFSQRKGAFTHPLQLLHG